MKDHLLQTIVNGVIEIEDKLKEILEEIVKNKWKNHRDPYYDLSKLILTKIDGVIVSTVLPENVLKLADLFWSFTPKNNILYSGSRIGVEKYFGIEDAYGDYFPSSSYQTPIYWLLQTSLKETIDFILNFTNKTADSFANSELGKQEVEEIEIFIDENNTIKQFICDRLWCTYRGTHVSPHVLESIHMALEKFILENAENTDSNILENWLIYLLKNSKSASISAVVTSIVLAYPEKTFNVAKILFKTKEFFFYDTNRLVKDKTHKHSLLMLKENFSIDSRNELYENERIEACDYEHRKWTLEHQFLKYQCFRDESTSEKEVKKRQKILWEIIDDYYENLPSKSEETESDKTWRLFLARMDRRKMNPTTEETNDGLIINWNPEIEPELKEYSDKSLEKNIEQNKYNSLDLWVNYKLRNDDQYKKYEKYENNPKIALKEVKEIINKNPDDIPYSFTKSLPAKVCSVLLKEYFDLLSEKEKSFCKEIVLEVTTFPFRDEYQYQVSDGTGTAISVLPVVLEKFPEEKELIKYILLFTLFKRYSINMANTEFNIFSINAIHELWKNNFNDAQSLLLGYLLLKPKYDELRKKLREEKYKKGKFDSNISEPLDEFIEQNESDISKIIECRLSLCDLKDIEQLDLYTLKIAFQLIPFKTDDKVHKEIVKKIILVFSRKLLSNDRDNKVDYMIEHDFLQKLAYFLLKSEKEEIEDYLNPFLENFNSSESMAKLFKQIILAEDKLNTYYNFWEIWNLFKGKIINICKDGNHWYVDKVIKNYLFATIPWKKTTKEWQTFKDDNKRFFKEISNKIGNYPSTIYAISKLLNDVGTHYLNDGIFWISNMIYSYNNLLSSKLETNTIYYLENITRKYIYKNREKVKRRKKIKDDISIILDFLIEKGSVVGFMLRENIL